jgi:hypothetical protein
MNRHKRLPTETENPPLRGAATAHLLGSMRVLFMSWSFLFLAALRGSPLAAAGPAPLDDALRKVAQDRGHWAYTQTDIVMNDKGKVLNEASVRYDPSKPYAEQYVPLEIDDHAPTRADFEHFRSQGERLGKRTERAEEAGQPPPGQTLGDLVDIDRATVATEDDTSITYDVPLRAEHNHRFPPDKFQVLMKVDKAHRTLEHIAVHLRAPLRLVLVVNVKSGELDVDFNSVDPVHNPAMTSVRGDGLLSIFFVNVSRNGTLTRTDFKHVTPFGERFNVQVGPVKALDF